MGAASPTTCRSASTRSSAAPTNDTTLRAWIRTAQLRTHLRERIGADWWRRAETGELLRELFAEGTQPTSEEIADRIGYDPLDTDPLLNEFVPA